MKNHLASWLGTAALSSSMLLGITNKPALAQFQPYTPARLSIEEAIQIARGADPNTFIKFH